MAYVFELAEVLSSQLKRIASFNAYELAGQAANLDFWMDESLHACQVIDGYQNRYKRMSSAITQYISDHNTVCFDPSDPHSYRESFYLTPAPPAKFPTSDLKEHRVKIVEAARTFLLRCYRVGFIDEVELKQRGERLGTSFEPRELVRK